MPITDNTFTAAELEAALTANPNLLNEIKTPLVARKFVVQDEAEHNAFKTNLETTVSSNLTKTHADKLEADVLELTGIKKDANEKYYDYFKRATTSKLSAVKQLETELEALKKNPNPSAQDKARIEQLEQGIADKDKAIADLQKESATKIKTLSVGSVIDAAIAGLRSKYRADLPASMIELAEKKIKDDLIAAAEVQDDGTITFKGADGKVTLDAGYKPKAADALVAEMMKDVIDAGKQQTGAGSKEGSQGPAGGTGKAGEKVVVTSLPAEVKTKVDLSSFLLKSGYLDGTEDFTKAFDTLGANLPLR
jgi:hypothetical protein